MVKGTSKIVESLHSTISQFTSVLGNSKEKTTGVTAAVYKSINTVTHLLGEGIDAILGKASQLQDNYAADHPFSSKSIRRQLT